MKTIIQKIIQYLKSVQVEMSKVSWPTRNELSSATVLVIVFSLFLALVVKIFDMALGKVLETLLTL